MKEHPSGDGIWTIDVASDPRNLNWSLLLCES